MTIVKIEGNVEKKGNRKIMRKRLRDWPQRVYKYYVEPDRFPEWVFDTARKMQATWNELAELYRRTRVEAQAELNKQKRKEIWKSMDEKALAIIKGNGFTWEIEGDLFDRFKTAARKGIVKPHFRLDRIRLIHRYTGGGMAVRHLLSEKAERFAMTLPALGHGHATGRFGMAGQSLNFRFVMHRLIPVDAIVKQSAFLGERHPTFGWQWAIAITVEEPPILTRMEGGIAALDLGWRVMEGFIRIGMIVDNMGRNIELRLPLHCLTAARRRSNMPSTFQDALKMSERIGQMRQAIKDSISPYCDKELVKKFPRTREQVIPLLPDLVKAQVEEWSRKDRYARREKAALLLHLIGKRTWLYGNIAAWLTKTYPLIVWEKDLGIKQMAEAEEQDYAIAAGQKYRHLAAISKLRLAIKNAAVKNGATVLNGETAFSTVDCFQCGERVENDGRLYLECSQGHRWDQDQNASRNLLSQTSTLLAQHNGLRNFRVSEERKEPVIPEQLLTVAVMVQ